VSTVRGNPKGMRRSAGLQSMGTIPKMNRSAKDGARSSLHYGDEGVLIHRGPSITSSAQCRVLNDFRFPTVLTLTIKIPCGQKIQTC
jgi:hypothetical protein